MERRAIGVESVPPSSIHITFNDGSQGHIEMSEAIKTTEAFAPLADPEFLARAEVDEIGGVLWPNGAGISPERLLEETQSQ